MSESNACDENMPTPPPPAIEQPQTPRRKQSAATNSVHQYSPAAACPLTPRPAPVGAFDVAQDVAASSPPSETDAINPDTFSISGRLPTTPCVEKAQRNSVAANHSLNPLPARKSFRCQRRNKNERERKHQELLKMANRELKEAYPVAEPKADEEQEPSVWPYSDPSLPASAYKVFCNRFSFKAPSRRTQEQNKPNISPRGSVSRPNADTSDEDMVKRPRRRVDSTDEPVTLKQTHSLPDAFGASKPIDIPLSLRTFNDLPKVDTSPNSLDDLPDLVPSTYEPHPGTPVDFSYSTTRKLRTGPPDYHEFLEKTRCDKPRPHRRHSFRSQANKPDNEALRDSKHDRPSKQVRVLGLAMYRPMMERPAGARRRDSTYTDNSPGDPDIWTFESSSPTLRKTTGRMDLPSLTNSLSTSPSAGSGRNSMTSETNSASTAEQERVRSRRTRNSGRAYASTDTGTSTSVSSINSTRDSSADKFLRHVRASKQARAAAEKEKEKKKSNDGIVVVGADEWDDWVDMDPL
ncbi:hypothetical protein FB567DRAFT_32103 [Paraphoma chrysanthemicola]|uniref:Uncharacterized protein n=1 Tax=Paraphoma chrysanthemicola TaxID=798071 RepID=A0A8K0RKK2_9PLEO|nr:hypothetical protein FB567DRAFT_32103 [Paraphoma chrysanthemicola]